jgi:kinesin family protein 18/19
MLSNIFDGFNVTCMAYGITGAGKTYTMLGNTMNSNLARNSKQVKGLSEQAMDYIFDFIKHDSCKAQSRDKAKNNVKYKIKISYLEVYNEHIRDLLREDKPINLIILEDAKHGIIVPGLKECEVHSSFEVISLINKGNNRRTMASTFSNKFSSRSHAIIQISMERTLFTNASESENTSLKSTADSKIHYLTNIGSSVCSKLTLVDLAGSEKEDQEDCVQDKHRLEGSNINRSLLALGNCIKILSQSKNLLHSYCYRER